MTLTPTTSQTYIVAADVLRGELSAAQQRLDHDALTALARGRAMLRQDILDGAAHADPAVRAALAAEITIECRPDDGYPFVFVSDRGRELLQAMRLLGSALDRPGSLDYHMAGTAIYADCSGARTCPGQQVAYEAWGAALDFRRTAAKVAL